MSQATIGALRVVLGLDSAQFSNGLSSAQRQLNSVGRRFQRIGAQMTQVGTSLTAAVTAPLIGIGVAASRAATESAAALAQVSSALTSMGEGAGRSLDQLTAQAERLMSTSLFDDDDILRSVTANLLTFGNVAEEQFDRAQQAILNVSARMGTDLQSATVAIGRALNDPIRGMTALRRQGIQFTAEQQDMIRAMQAAGDMAGAQSVMLAELERQFGGAAEAARGADPMRALMLQVGEALESIGAVVNRVLPPVVQFITRLLDGFQNLSPRAQEFIVIAGGIAAALGPLLLVGGAIASAIGALIPLLPVIAPIAAAVAALVAAFALFGDDVGPVLQRFGERAREVLGPELMEAFDAIKAAVQAIGNAFSQFMQTEAGQALSAFQQAYMGVLGEALIRILDGVLNAVETVFTFVADAMNLVAAVLRGDWSGAWRAACQLVGNLLSGLWSIMESLFPEITGWLQGVYEGARRFLMEGLRRVFDWVTGAIERVGDAFQNLWDRVVGHSYIPDMVIAIGEWMATLQERMVDPALDAVEQTSQGFSDMAASVEDQIGGLIRSLSTKDWKGALRGLLDILGQVGGQSWWGRLARIGSSAFSGGGRLPGFASGGSFTVGGRSGIDRNVVAFRATRGETVDVRKPGNDMGGTVAVYVQAGEYFDARVERVAGPMDVRTGRMAAQAGAGMAQHRFARRSRDQLGKSFGTVG